MDKRLMESGASSNSFTFKICILVMTGIENQLNVTAESPLKEDLPCLTHI